MKEYIDMRWISDPDNEAFAEGLGATLMNPIGIVYRLRIPISDPRYLLAKTRFNQYLRDNPGKKPGVRNFVDRKYKQSELDRAEYLRLIIAPRAVFYPHGEATGTIYDDSSMCPKCGWGRRQVSPLRLKLNRIRKGVDVARTVQRAYEYVVSQRFVDIVNLEGVTGLEFAPVEDTGRKKVEAAWYQIVVTGRAELATPPTQFGYDYLMDNPEIERENICVEHENLGLNLLSEAHLRADLPPDSEFSITRQRSGEGRNFDHTYIITQRLYRLLRECDVQGFDVEVAHVAK